MPELPEVETIVRQFRPQIVGRQIMEFGSSWPRSISPGLADVRRDLRRRTIENLTRRGKQIVFHLDRGAWLLVHLRMSGRLEWAPVRTGLPPHARSWWDLAGAGRLLLCDARKFGRIVYTRNLDAATAELGPEPLSPRFTARRLGQILRTRHRQLKPLLLDQSVIAGLGNIYVDESLFAAGLHPLTCSSRLSDEQVRGLHAAIRRVLRAAIRRQGTTIDWIYPGGRMQERLRVYGRAGRPCSRCGTPIEALRVAQRGTHICPTCQPRPRRRTRKRSGRT
jgi:formamidopyrimidine-DNA glycosylase